MKMEPRNFKRQLSLFLTAGIIITIIVTSCTKDSAPPLLGDYPTEIGKIFTYRCATSGCHNESSANGAAGLSLSTYASLFKGSVNGSPVIPYRSDFSSLCFFINTFDDLGPKNLPTMPINSNPLSRSEVETIKNWIDAGAPDINGNVMWADNPARKKYYVLNQGCDVVTVFDAATQLPMRYITVGRSSVLNKIPHRIEVSHDGQYWYVIFTGDSVMQKYRSSDDSFVAEVSLGGYINWSSLVISNDNKWAYCISWQLSSRLAVVNLENMTLKANMGGGNFTQGHGVTLNKNNDTLYITNQYGNYIYKIDTALNGFNEVIIDHNPGLITNSLIDPHEIMFSPDGSKYFITCQATGEVRVMSTHGDHLLQVINVGSNSFPQEMVKSVAKNKLYVSCSEGVTGNNTRGSVAVIDMTSLSVSTYPVGYQPHGIALDETNGYVIVASRNIASTGPVPHHTSVCGRNGFVNYFDINTMQLLNKKTEVASDPYSVSMRP